LRLGGLDPWVSPRNQNPVVPYLSFYYLAALSIGYFTGYFVSVWNKFTRVRRVALYRRVQTLVAGASGPFLLVPAILPTGTRKSNQQRTAAARYAEQLAASLPDEPIAVLSDDLACLTLLQAATVQSGKNKDWLLCADQRTAHSRLPLLEANIAKHWPYEPR
jgi:hypothetical protein